jgi:splicing factor 45
MLGGLYGDLPPPSSSAGDDDKASTASVWSSATKMAPPTLRKPASTFAPPPSVLRNQHLRQPRAAAAAAPTSAAPVIEAAAAPVPAAFFQPAFVAVQSLEEYDPARPNDYEDYRKEKLRRAKEAELNKELERRRREEQGLEREREQREREAREREEREYQSRASSLNISGEEAWKKRAAMSGGAAAAAQRTPSSPPNGDGFAIGSSSSAGLGVGAGGQMTAAQRMMAKMGWKEGQGLGKQEQGITAPLVAKKTDRRGGVIIDESNSKPEKKPKSVNFDGAPSRVLLLRNMVNPC